VTTRTPQNVAITMVFLLLGGVSLLTMAPFELGTIRLAGVSLLWWYGLVVVPAVVVGATIATLIRRVPRASLPPVGQPSSQA
jgi:hypothetical protein